MIVIRFALACDAGRKGFKIGLKSFILGLIGLTPLCFLGLRRQHKGFKVDFKEIIFEKKACIATITINRPDKYNACTPLTILELNQALTDCWVDESVGVVVLTGAGDKAFCTGGDLSIRDKEGYAGTIASLPLEVGCQSVT